MLGTLLAFSTLLTWSLSDLVVKYVVGKCPTLTLLFWGQILGGGIVLLLGVVLGEIQAISMGALLWAGFLGAVNMLGMYTFYKSVEHKGVALTLPIVYSWSVPTLIFNYFFLHELPNSLQLIGIFTVIAGLFLVCMDRQRTRWVDSRTLFAFISMLTWALFYFLLSKLSELYGEWLMSSGIKMVTGLYVVPLLLYKSTATLKISRFFWPVALIGLCDAVGLVAITYAFQLSSSAVVSGITSTTPVFVAAVGIFFYKEKVAPAQILGIAITVCGLVVLSV